MSYKDRADISKRDEKYEQLLHRKDALETSINVFLTHQNWLDRRAAIETNITSWLADVGNLNGNSPANDKPDIIEIRDSFIASVSASLDNSVPPDVIGLRNSFIANVRAILGV